VPGTLRRWGVDGIDAWRGLELVEPVEEGNRNEVWRASLRGHTVSVRRSRRNAASLQWELDLIDRLDRLGFTVPAVHLTDDDRPSHKGLVVQRWIDGHAPASPSEWAAVGRELQRLHTELAEHPQRPGCLTVLELERTSVSVDADLAALPDDVAHKVLELFRSFADAPIGVIHGDPAPSNLRILPDGRVGLLDFDESRRDVLWHDLSNLGVQVLPDGDHRRALQLSDAWEAANAWVVEPDYARERLAALDD